MGSVVKIKTESNADATFLNMPTALTTDTPAEVELSIEGLELTINSESTTWDSADPMQYTIVVDNKTPSPLTAPIVVKTDVFPTAFCDVDAESVQLNGGTIGFNASAEGGVLTVNLTDNIDGGHKDTITFQVKKVAS